MKTIEFLSRFDGESVIGVESSRYGHYVSSSLGNYKGSALVTGGDSNKTEIFDSQSQSWRSVADYPIVLSSTSVAGFQFAHYGTASTAEAVFIIGGWDGYNYLSNIMKYEDDLWTSAGKLQQTRGYHSVISLGSSKMIIGGQSSNVEP